MSDTWNVQYFSRNDILHTTAIQAEVLRWMGLYLGWDTYDVGNHQ